MSRTQKIERLETPVKKTYFMDMQTGKVGYNQEGVKEIQEAELPIYLIPLDDRCFRISGSTGIGKQARRIKSTIGHSEKKPIIKVFYDDNKQELGTGKWSDGELKGRLSPIGAKYTSVLTAYDPKSKEIVSFQFRGKAFAAYLKLGESKQAKGDLPNKLAQLNEGLTIKATEKTPSESGIDSFVPVFGFFSVKENIGEEANQADEILQDYYKEFFKQEQTVEVLDDEPAPNIQYPPNATFAPMPNQEPNFTDQQRQRIERPFQEFEVVQPMGAPPEPADDLPF